MYKHFFACLLLLINVDNHSKHHSNDNNVGMVLPVLVGTGILVGTGVYWSMRESNAIKMQRAINLSQFYSANIHYALSEIRTIKDVCAFLEQSARFKKEMYLFIDLIQYYIVLLP